MKKALFGGIPIFVTNKIRKPPSKVRIRLRKLLRHPLIRDNERSFLYRFDRDQPLQMHDSNTCNICKSED